MMIDVDLISVTHHGRVCTVANGGINVDLGEETLTLTGPLASGGFALFEYSSRRMGKTFTNEACNRELLGIDSRKKRTAPRKPYFQRGRW